MGQVRFGWLGLSRQNALRLLICAEVAGWSLDWWIDHAKGEVEVRSLDGVELHLAPTMAYIASSHSGTLAINLGGKDVEAIGRHLLGIGNNADAGWAHQIGEEALNALSTRLFCRAGADEVPQLVESVRPPECERSCLGAVHVDIVVGRLSWRLALDRQLADCLVPPQAVGGPALTSRSTAIDEAVVNVDAVIGFGSVSLTELADLKVGEVLIGERSLQDALQLHIQGHGPVAGGYLKRLGERRAVILDGTYLHGSKS